MATTAEATPALLKVLDGTVDLHCHSGPSPFPRRLDHVEASYDGARINMRGILVKSHHHNTAMDVLAMKTQLKDAPTPVWGGVALNSEVGGINPSATALAINMGGRCVFGPTVSAGQHLCAHSSGDGFPSAAGELFEKEVSIYDETGDVSADTHQVLQLVADADILLTGGHLDGPTMKTFLRTAHDKGVRRMLLHHPDYIVDVDDSDLEEMVGFGVFVEHDLAMYHPDVTAVGWPIEKLVNWIRKIGPEHTVINSDLGQVGNPLPVDAYLLIVQRLLDSGIPAADIRQMICANTAFLLGLEEKP